MAMFSPFRSLRLRALLLTSALLSISAPAFAAECHGRPDALGTSRTLVVDPMAHPRLGTMQYPETLPLADHEVVLTFDDGPLPPHSSKVLDMLKAECVKATFFIIGRMARQFPSELKRIAAEGHTIATHSENHPLAFERMSIDKVRQEVETGIHSTKTALGDAGTVAPFFRIPGLLRAPAVEDYLASQGLQAWSADFPADDWKHISASEVASLAISRLEAKKKGVLLLHDIQARTVGAMPTILRELKARGYRVVHVVPSGPGLPPTPTEPGQWRLRPLRDVPLATRWPQVPRFVFTTVSTLPAPEVTASETTRGLLHPSSTAVPRVKGKSAKPVVRTDWPHPNLDPELIRLASLPVPAADLFELRSIADPEQRPRAAVVRAVSASAVRPMQAAATSLPPIGQFVSAEPFSAPHGGADTVHRLLPGSVAINPGALQRGSAGAR